MCRELPLVAWWRGVVQGVRRWCCQLCPLGACIDVSAGMRAYSPPCGCLHLSGPVAHHSCSAIPEAGPPLSSGAVPECLLLSPPGGCKVLQLPLLAAAPRRVECLNEFVLQAVPLDAVGCCLLPLGPCYSHDVPLCVQAAVERPAWRAPCGMACCCLHHRIPLHCSMSSVACSALATCPHSPQIMRSTCVDHLSCLLL